jgi:hypothetical protein
MYRKAKRVDISFQTIIEKLPYSMKGMPLNN